jgi:hypothetical protein
METALGLVGIAVFIVAVIAFAAGVTWVVVKLTPLGADEASTAREPSSEKRLRAPARLQGRDEMSSTSTDERKASTGLKVAGIVVALASFVLPILAIVAVVLGAILVSRGDTLRGIGVMASGLILAVLGWAFWFSQAVGV